MSTPLRDLWNAVDKLRRRVEAMPTYSDGALISRHPVLKELGDLLAEHPVDIHACDCGAEPGNAGNGQTAHPGECAIWLNKP